MPIKMKPKPGVQLTRCCRLPSGIYTPVANKDRCPRYPQREPGRDFIMQINTSAQDSTPEAHTQSSEVDNTQSSSFRVSKNKKQTYLRSCNKAYPTSISRNASSSRKLSTPTPAQFQMSSPTSRNLQASSILGHHKVLYDRCY